MVGSLFYLRHKDIGHGESHFQPVCVSALKDISKMVLFLGDSSPGRYENNSYLHRNLYDK